MFAHALRESGQVSPGDTVCFALGNVPVFLPVFWGTTLARAVAATLHPSYKVEENKFYLEDSGAKLLVLDAGAPPGTCRPRHPAPPPPGCRCHVHVAVLPAPPRLLQPPTGPSLGAGGDAFAAASALGIPVWRVALQGASGLVITEDPSGSQLLLPAAPGELDLVRRERESLGLAKLSNRTPACARGICAAGVWFMTGRAPALVVGAGGRDEHMGGGPTSPERCGSPPPHQRDHGAAQGRATHPRQPHVARPR